MPSLIQAKALGHVRFRELCRALGFTGRHPKLRQHESVAAIAEHLVVMRDLPDDDARLALTAEELRKKVSR